MFFLFSPFFFKAFSHLAFHLTIPLDIPLVQQKRINEDLPGYISKAYWTQAANEERRQLQTLRFDINNLVEEKSGDKAAAKAFYKSIEKMDFAIRQKDQATAQAAVVECQEKGNALLKSLA